MLKYLILILILSAPAQAATLKRTQPIASQYSQGFEMAQNIEVIPAGGGSPEAELIGYAATGVMLFSLLLGDGSSSELAAAEEIPSPALLPVLLAFGVAAVWQRKRA